MKFSNEIMLFLTSQWIVFNSKKYNFIYLTKKIYYRCSCVKSATNFLLLIQKTCNGLSYTKSTQDPFISVKYNPFSVQTSHSLPRYIKVINLLN
ncbi:hypothetical protein OIU77_000644 [Salix suchowensis]|uniref:Uncharacterized protein n=1 Tax=Salix suchowensis TaxID=1278906 RepID=A0ABQ9B9M6_9ROSI|nr:hypothetical protein OIU77_000644 [Salix suchowensis]KAJ6375719.1 hypothetical protein OIU77_000644 [Salix suchowensis]